MEKYENTCQVAASTNTVQTIDTKFHCQDKIQLRNS